jgi:hypothetical protein
MKKELKNFYYEIDETLETIEKRLKRDNKDTNIKPVIFNFDEVPFWYYKKP